MREFWHTEFMKGCSHLGSKVVQEGQCQKMSADSIHCEKIEKKYGLDSYRYKTKMILWISLEATLTEDEG